jgi:protein-tyrosine phosphatase
MAVALFKQKLAGREDAATWRVESAGTWPLEGQSASERAVQVLAQRGLDAGAHRARVVSAGLLSDFDLVLVMERGHKEALQAEFPDLSRKVYMLTELTGPPYDVADPYGRSLQDYEETATELSTLLDLALPGILELVRA